MSTIELTLDESISGVIREAYRAFNARELDAALAMMQSNVEWPNGMEGGTVYGHAGVRDYWTRQWNLIDPHVDPVAIDADGSGRVVVSVHQVVRDPNGKLLLDRMVKHIYSFEDSLIRSMEIRE
ncbi:MAG TPA: nuclear transport factor 2 family protein [Candidatus Eremiobacteraceae bacterium]|nr:nuclear transport factor 2 family protein [Candidatus Eremiobacteraceae bacterium]